MIMTVLNAGLHNHHKWRADNLDSVFRHKPTKISIGEIKLSGAYPAFKEWALRIKSGEKLHRGKYFNRWNIYRLFLTQ